MDVGESEVKAESEVDVLDIRDVDNVERVVRVSESVREAVLEEEVRVELVEKESEDTVPSVEWVAEDDTMPIRREKPIHFGVLLMVELVMEVTLGNGGDVDIGDSVLAEDAEDASGVDGGDERTICELDPGTCIDKD